MPQAGQWVGMTKAALAAVAQGHDRPDDLGDHVAGAAHHHRVADHHAAARDLVLVVQGGLPDRHAADPHRLQHRERGGPAGAADADTMMLRSLVLTSSGGYL